jgi:purine-binding chemotaxis protein CheW
MRRIFGLPDLPLDPDNRIVVVPLGTAPSGQLAVVGIVMDTVRQVLRVPGDLVHPLPEFVAPPGRQSEVESVCRLDGGQRLVSVLSTDRMFDHGDRAELAGLADDEADKTIDGGRDEMGDDGVRGIDDECQLVVFRLGDEEFGVAVDDVQEIIRVPDSMSQVPRTLDFVEGLVNLRSTVLPVIDLRVRLGLERAARDERQRIVVLTVNGVRTGFVVDAVAEVLKLSNDAIETAPTLTAEQAELIGQVANLADRSRMLLILDTSRLLAGDHAAAIASSLAA